MLATKQENKGKTDDRFQTALKYLDEYRGIKGAVIFDIEGLVVGWIGQEKFDAEFFSALALLMLDQVNNVLIRLNENHSQSMTIRTNDSWITFKVIGSFVLAVNAESNTDKLLKVRIEQAIEMIKTHLKDKYPLIEK